MDQLTTELEQLQMLNWGAITGNGLAAFDGSLFRRVVSIAVPPFSAMNPSRGHVGPCHLADALPTPEHRPAEAS